MNQFFVKIHTLIKIFIFYYSRRNEFKMKSEPRRKFPNKKIIKSAKFEAKEQFTKSALENLKTENERIVNSLKQSGEID